MALCWVWANPCDLAIESKGLCEFISSKERSIVLRFILVAKIIDLPLQALKLKNKILVEMSSFTSIAAESDLK